MKPENYFKFVINNKASKPKKPPLNGLILGQEQPDDNIQNNQKSISIKSWAKHKESKKKIKLYDDEVCLETKNFWKDITKIKVHAISKNIILSKYGDKLSRISYKYVKDRVNQLAVNLHDIDPIMDRICKLEYIYKERLEETAKQLVSQLWDMPVDLLTAELTTDISRISSDADNDINKLSPKIAAETQKRILMNTLARGAAIHSSYTLHHMARNLVNKIDPELLGLYDRISALFHYQYWFASFGDMFRSLTDNAIGSSDLTFIDGEVNICARGVIFPILLHELIRGVMELLSYHQIPGISAKEAVTVVNYGDSIKYEPYQIQAGPELWRRFLTVANNATRDLDVAIPDVIAAMSMESPGSINKIIRMVLDNNPTAEKLIRDLVYSEDDPEFDEFDELEELEDF